MLQGIEDFESFFRKCTGQLPYPYQRKLGEDGIRSRVIHVPTGAGKTAAAVVAWLWRRAVDGDDPPRRLVYCLPMRVLVEQTRDNAREWVEAAGLKDEVRVYTLMGGEVEEDWEVYPEKAAILVGTQDMLLSRALNRGYAMSRYKWPVHFGLLNNDCLWVCDEVQLMGSGLGTTTQLQALREDCGVCGPAATWWMSATMDRSWLETVDYRERAKGLDILAADAGELGVKYTAQKPIKGLGNLRAEDTAKKHVPGTLTLVVVNTVGRARSLYEALAESSLTKRGRKDNEPELLLVHSRFRPKDRARQNRRLLVADRTLRGGRAEDLTTDEQEWAEGIRLGGVIAVATQAVEAGVDISAQTLITELAPWASLVQRFGRCNRFGKQDGKIFWVDLADDQALPYEAADLRDGRQRLGRLKDSDARIAHVEELGAPARRAPACVIRQHDLYGLFSTEPDLAGGFTDVSAFVRDLKQETDVHVFWREFTRRPGAEQAEPCRDELCPVPVYEIGALLGRTGLAWEWDGEREEWVHRRGREIRPGMTLLLEAGMGGYREAVGWSGRPGDKPRVLGSRPALPDGISRDGASETDWQELAEHLGECEAEARALISAMEMEKWAAEAVVTAARWHDVGKSHEAWQRELLECTAKSGIRPPGEGLWAKFPRTQKQFRPGVRHEAASALAAWQQWRAGMQH